MGDTYTCVVDGHKHKFRYIEGLRITIKQLVLVKKQIF